MFKYWVQYYYILLHLFLQAAMRTKFSEKIQTNFIKQIDKKLLLGYNKRNGYNTKGLISMYYNEKRKAITAKYVKTHLDDIKIRVPKGQREKLKSIASEMGISMNQMFIKAVEEYIEKNYKPEAESETD